MPATRSHKIRVIGALSVIVVPLVSTPAQAATTARTHRATLGGRAHALPVVVHRAPTPEPSIGAPQPEKSPNVPVTLNSLTRDPTGIVTLVWTVKNNGNESFYAPGGWQGVYTYAGAPLSGVSLTDETAKVRYQPLRIDPRRLCMCNNPADQPEPLASGDVGQYFQSYKLPNSVKSVTVALDGYAPAKNVPVSG